MVINYEKDIYTAIAMAIETRNIGLVESVMNQTRYWMESNDVKLARNSMLAAVSNLIYEVEDLV